MMNNPHGLQNQPEVDHSKAMQIIKWLLLVEDENDKTKKATDPEMVQKIGKRIQDDVKCI